MSRILWVSPYAIHDTSSGAALFALTLLKLLKRVNNRNFEVQSLSAFVFDNLRGSSKFDNFAQLQNGKEESFSFEADGITFHYTKTQSTNDFDMNLEEQNRFYEKYLEILYTFKPDFIFGYGGDMLSSTVFDKARLLGIPSAYFLCNGNHKGYTFPGFSCVLTDSKATANYYKENYGINVIPFGILIDRELVLAKEKKGQYITFINPVLSKGLSFFVKIALIFKEKYPEIRFLVVASRGTLDATISHLKVYDKKSKTYSTPYNLSMFSNVDVAEHTPNIALAYEQTRVLLAPALGYESWGRVATEATFNHIPVLASTQGGLQEAVAGAGVNLEIKKEYLEDYLLVPDDKEIKPWVENLYKLYKDAESWKEKCDEAIETNDMLKSLQRFVNIIDPFLNLHAGDKITKEKVKK